VFSIPPRSSGSAQVSCTVPAGLCFVLDAAYTEMYTLSLHDALPILLLGAHVMMVMTVMFFVFSCVLSLSPADLAAAKEQNITILDRKSTRLNSSHVKNSYAVFCLKRKIPGK